MAFAVNARGLPARGLSVSKLFENDYRPFVSKQVYGHSDLVFE